MDYTVNACATKWVTTSGTGVLGVSGKPIILQGMLACGVSSQTVALYSGAAVADGVVVTMAVITMTGKAFLPFPMDAPGGLYYQTQGNPGDADIKLLFFWIPGERT